MYKIIKQKINSSGAVIESSEVGIFIANSNDVFITKLAKLVNAYNTKLILRGSDDRYRFIIENVHVFNINDFNDWIKSDITDTIDICNRTISYINSSATISARKRNFSKVQTIKELDVTNYLYPISLEIKTEDLLSKLIVY